MDYSVTLGGVLYYRGAIANYLEKGIPLSQWNSPALLSYFCSNVDRERNFSLSFEQTCVRVAIAISDMGEGCSTPLQQAYLLACLEAKGSTNTVSEHQAGFIEVLKSRQDQFPIIGRHKTTRVMPKIYQRCHQAAKQWNDGLTEPDCLGALQFFLEICSKKITLNVGTRKFDGVNEEPVLPVRTGRNKGHGRGQPQKQTAPDDMHGHLSIPQMNIVHQQEPITMDFSMFDVGVKSNPLFRGLVEKMPGWHPYEVLCAWYEDDSDTVVDYGKMVIGNDATQHDSEGINELALNFGNMNVSGWMHQSGEDVEMNDAA